MKSDNRQKSITAFLSLKRYFGELSFEDRKPPAMRVVPKSLQLYNKIKSLRDIINLKSAKILNLLYRRWSKYGH